jgi:hypothetical protein
MFGFEHMEDPTQAWQRVRNHLLKRYPPLWNYDLVYKKGQEIRLFRRIMFITGLSEKKLKEEIQIALSPAAKRNTMPSQYY